MRGDLARDAGRFCGDLVQARFESKVTEVDLAPSLSLDPNDPFHGPCFEDRRATIGKLSETVCRGCLLARHNVFSVNCYGDSCFPCIIHQLAYLSIIFHVEGCDGFWHVQFEREGPRSGYRLCCLGLRYGRSMKAD